MCMAVEPFPKLLEPQKFTSDQLYSLQRIGGNDLLNAVTSLDLRALGIISALEIYYVPSNGSAKLGAGQLVEGTTVSRDFTAEELARIEPEMAVLDRVCTRWKT